MNPRTTRACGHEDRLTLSRRVPAALMVGVLAFGSISPSLAFAGEGDRDIEGGAAPEDVGGGGDVELGAPGDLAGDGGEAPAPDDAGPPAAPEPPSAPKPVDVAPEPTAVAVEPAPSAPVAPAAAPVVGSGPTSAPAPAVAAPPVISPRQSAPQAVEAHRRVRVSHRVVRVKPRAAERRVVVAPRPRVGAPAAVAPRTARVPRRVVVTLSAATPTRKLARRGDRTHVVAPGESLWSIAADLLGSDASSERIGREVERLWQTNRARIGTGDRDVLLAGTRLVLA
jgi:hypothetical protein